MLLNNYDAYKNFVLSSDRTSDIISLSQPMTSVDNTTVNELYVATGNTYAIGVIYYGGFYTNSGGSNQTILWVGTGTGDTTKDMHGLVSPCADNAFDTFKSSEFTVERSVNSTGNENATYLKFTRTFKPLTDMTITEVGLVKQLKVGSNTNKNFCLTRVLLAKPIKAQAKQPFTVVYVLKVDG